jgi:hypothetical protein
MTGYQQTLGDQSLAGLDDTRLTEQIILCDLPHGGETRTWRYSPGTEPAIQRVNDLLDDRHLGLSIDSQVHEQANSCDRLTTGS